MEQKIKRDRFDEILSKLRRAIKCYDIKYYAYKRFNLFLANGERINYSIPENIIAHLLGVNTNYLNSLSILTTENKSSISILREFCKEENSYMLYKKVNEEILDLAQLFSEHIDKKIEIFEDNIKPLIFNMEFVCKINRSKIHNQGIDYMDINYLICSKDQQGRYMVLGIVDNIKTYVARTSMLYETQEEMLKELKDILFEQELTFVTGLQITNVAELDFKYKPISLDIDSKKEKIDLLRFYKREFSGYIDVTTDYSFTLNQNKNQYNVGKEIVKYMRQRQLIDLDDFSMQFYYIPDNLRIVIEEYNNSLCNGGDEIANQKYSELAIENHQLREEIRLLKQKNKELTERESRLLDDLTETNKENSQLVTCYDEIQKILLRVKK